MTYKEWFINQSNLHKKVIEKLSNLTQKEIIEYFSYDNMKKCEENFCLLYKDNKKCHDIKNLNCYLCACPYFRFNDNGLKNEDEKIVFSFCSINSKYGAKFEFENKIHQDCSNCTIPHKIAFIKKNFDKNWLNIMKDCELN